MRRNLVTAISALLGGGCIGGSGSLDLSLSLPPSGDLRPTGMTTVGVTVIKSDGSMSVTTTPLVPSDEGLAFSAGDVDVGDPITLRIELRDAANRLVGFGSVDTPVTPSATDDISVTIPVRKPITYVSGDRPVLTLDSTRDALDPKYQSSMTPTGVVVVPVDGTELVAITATNLQRFATATHMPIGSPIAISGTPLDATAVPGERRVVIGTMTGAVVVNLDTGELKQLTTTRADRVTVGGTVAPRTVFVLTNRVGPPTGAGSPCTGTSTVSAVSLDGGTETPVTVSMGAPISDIAAGPQGIYGANPCQGQVKRLDSGGMTMFPLQGAAAVAIEGGRVWAAGSLPPVTGNDPKGARIVITSIRLDGSDMRTVQLPPKTELVTYDNDQAHEFSLILHADTEVPIELAIGPSAEFVAVVARMDTHRAARSDALIGKIVPEMNCIVHDIVIADSVKGTAQRIRAKCDLMLINNSNALFPDWSCAPANESEIPAGGPFIPSSVGVMFGAR